MMELENIVANTVYIQAKESGFNKDKGRSKRWRELLAFPHISQCQTTHDTIDRSYAYIVERQPIGKLLMWEFCRTKATFKNLVDFADAVESFRVSSYLDRHNVAKEIIQNYFLCDRLDQVSGIDNSDIISAINSMPKDQIPTKIIFDQTLKKVVDSLQSEAFPLFLDSIYFSRYLQWKYLEKLPVTKHTFRMYRVLGKGGFGEVCACQVRATGKLYACKKLDKKRMKKRRGEVMAYTEKLILQKVNSPFVVSLAYAFETKDSLCLVLTIMNGGDLRFHIHQLNAGAGFPETRAIFYASEILLGLEHLHSLNIVYRDLKPCNILIDDQGHVRISDLGLATVIDPGKKVKGRFGTLGYMAPEVLNNESYSFSPDWFGFGCIVYEMIMGLAPFRKRRNERLKRDEFDKRVCLEPEEYDSKFSDHARSLCKALLEKNPQTRLGCDLRGTKAVKEHPWFDNVNWERTEARLESPPFQPELHAVYAKDVLDIEQFSTVRGVKITPTDLSFYEKFCTGAVSIPWQNQMIETECYKDLNVFYDEQNNLVENLDPTRPPQPKKSNYLLCGLQLNCLRGGSSSPLHDRNKDSQSQVHEPLLLRSVTHNSPGQITKKINNKIADEVVLRGEEGPYEVEKAIKERRELTLDLDNNNVSGNSKTVISQPANNMTSQVCIG